MRILIALLFVTAVVTGIVAYGPTLGFLERKAEAVVASAVPEAPPPVVEAPPPVPTVVAAGEEIPGAEGLRFVEARIERTLTEALGARLEPSVADPLTQVIKRQLVWWIDLRRDLRPGDRIAAIYSLPPGEEPRLEALEFTSEKHRTTWRSFAFTSTKERFRRFYLEDGREVEERLEDSPINDYEQVTSLLRDGRGHQGVDFKTPVGTSVFAPFDGKVVRRNWGSRRNGNCLDIAGPGGVNAFFLHLHTIEPSMTPGTRVKKGQLIAQAGNTGRSTAPHLHYQLMRGKKMVDPYKHHRTRRVTLGADELPTFQATVSRLSALMAEQSSAERAEAAPQP